MKTVGNRHICMKCNYFQHELVGTKGDVITNVWACRLNHALIVEERPKFTKNIQDDVWVPFRNFTVPEECPFKLEYIVA